MIEQSLSIKDIVGLIADIMTLFGISGLFAWSFVRKSIESRSVADAGVTIFAYSMKTFLSLFLLLLLYIPAFFSHFFLVLVVSSHYGEGDGLWNAHKPFAYVLAYTVTALWFIPVSVLSVSSIFTWSLDPFKLFLRTFTGNRGN